MAMRAPLALASWAFVAAATTAKADERPVVVVDATTDGSGAAVVVRLNAALGPEPTLGPIAPVLVDALANPTPVDGAAIASASTALTNARDRLVRFAYGEAAAIARAAEDALAGEAGDKTARELLANLAFVEGLAIAGDAGDAGAAAPTWTLVHRLSPGRTLDPAVYPPDQIAAFARAVTPPPGSGAVMIAAPGADEILVDGAPIGRDPAVAQLSPGPHVVSARGADIILVGRRVVASAGQSVRVDLNPVLAAASVRAARARDRLRAAVDDGQRFAAIAALLAVGNADDAIVVVPGEDGTPGAVATRVYTRRGGLGPARSFDGDLGGVLAPLRPPPRPRLPPGPPTGPPVPPPGPEVPWHERRWARVGMGVAGAAVVTAVIAAILTRANGTTALDGSIGVQ